MEQDLIEYLNALRNFGSIYTRMIINGSAKSKIDSKMSMIRGLYAFRDRDSLTMKELADNIRVKLPNMTLIVDGLIKEGLVERDRAEDDRRKVIVKLTSYGQTVREEFLMNRHIIANNIFSRLDRKDKEELSWALQKACDIFEKAFAEEDLKN